MLASLRTLGTLMRGRRGGDQRQSLDAFYGPQAEHYDHFRERLLHGRQALLQQLEIRPGERVIELGGGTGRNLEFIADRIPACARIDLVDLCAPLLRRAEQRIAAHGWQAVIHTHLANACTWQPNQPVDVVYCSYSLSMIPEWRVALANACTWLRPGGRLGIVDFYVDRQHPWWTRTFWPRWFAHDGVYLRPDYHEVLAEHLDLQQLVTARGRVPWLAGLRVPYFRAIGYKKL